VSQDEDDEPMKDEGTSGNLTSNRDKLAKQAALGAQADKAVVEDDDDGEDDDGDWAMDTSADAVKAREAKAQESFEKIEAATKALDISDAEPAKKEKKKKAVPDEDKFGDEEEIEALRQVIAVKVRAAMVSSAEGDTAAAISSLMAIAKEHDIGPIDLFGFLLAEFNETAVKQLSTHKTVLTKLMKAAPDKKKTQKFILGQVEELLGERQKDALLKKTPVFLKAMYDIDLLDEETIVKWFDKGSKKKLGKAVREAAEPFVNWLKEADEDDDDDDDDDDDE
jgi:translation initiation factor 5